jgi:hypothetical protein
MRALLRRLEEAKWSMGQVDRPSPQELLMFKMSSHEPEPKHLPFLQVAGLSQYELEFIDTLPRIPQDELWDAAVPRLDSPFERKMPQWFVGELKGDITVLVNTGGKDFCQHVARLMGLDH